MATSKYTYTISIDFPSHAVAPDALAQEIQSSAIAVAYDHISTSGDSCDVWFKSSLPPADEAVLDALVAAHLGEPLPSPASLVSLDAPTTDDGKLQFTPNIYPDYTVMCLPGRGDDRSLGRWKGPKFTITSETEGDETVEWSFNDWIWIAGGSARWRGGEPGDTFTFGLRSPATPIVPNAQGTGNCNLVDPGVGAAIMIVPAQGNGAYDVDLSQAVPIPASLADKTPAPGYYDWDRPRLGLGTVTPSAPGQGGYNLFAIAIPLSTFAPEVPFVGAMGQDFFMNSVIPKLVLPHWKFYVTVHNSGHAGLFFCWHLVMARVATT